MQYVVVFEKASSNYAAFVPDLPGCVATGATREEVEQLIREGIQLYIDTLREDGKHVPEPSAWAELVEA
jgi:predicted RNase H-like HicB family nuclease